MLVAEDATRMQKDDDAPTPPGQPLPFDQAELAALPAADRRLITRETIARWTANLAPDGLIAPAEIARLERGRRQALETLRHGIELTDQEFQLVRLLQRHEGRTVTFAEIIRHLWPDDARGARPSDLWARHGTFARHMRTVHVIMHTARRKLEVDILRPQHLVSIRSVGYRWYSRPPSRDDGEDYGVRTDEARQLRYEIRGHRGELPPPREPHSGRFAPGPEHPDFQAIDAAVTDRRSRRQR